MHRFSNGLHCGHWIRFLTIFLFNYLFDGQNGKARLGSVSDFQPMLMHNAAYTLYYLDWHVFASLVRLMSCHKVVSCERLAF